MIRDFISFDIETTGLDNKKDEIIEIGCYKFLDAKIDSTFSFIIKPQKKVPTFIKQITGLTDKMLGDGKEIIDVLKEFITFVGDYPIVSHNIQFDIGFLEKAFLDNGFIPLNNTLFDTLSLSRIFLLDIPNHKLESVGNYFKLKYKSLHRAKEDAKLCGHIFLKIQKHIQNEISIDLLRMIINLSERAQNGLVPIFTNILQSKLISPLKKGTPFLRAKNFIKYKSLSQKATNLENIFKENGLLSKHISNYEFRPLQLKMAQTIKETIEGDSYLIAEAGTGCGKSFSYLIPALFYSIENREPVIVSTNTKNLQTQLFDNDIPIISKIIPKDFSVLLLKGRENYICNKKWEDTIFNIQKLNQYRANLILRLVVWYHYTEIGDISGNTSFSKKQFSWNFLAADRFTCLGKQCSFYKNECFFFKARRKMNKANLVVLNHSLLLSDIENKQYDSINKIILDEAHNLQNAAFSCFSKEFSNKELKRFLTNFKKSKKSFLSNIKKNIKSSTLTQSKKVELKIIIDKLLEKEEKKSESHPFFKQSLIILKKHGIYKKYRVSSIDNYPQKVLIEILKTISEKKNNLKQLIELFKKIEENSISKYHTHSQRLKRVFSFAEELKAKLKIFCNPQFEQAAFWLEEVKNEAIICFTPLDVGDILKEHFYPKFDSIIFTSATLSIRGNFKYFKKNLGLKEKIKELVFPSPFDYKKVSNVFVTNFLPEPRDSNFNEFAVDFIKEIILQTKVGTMVLFTSYNDLENAFNTLSPIFYRFKIPIFAQGKNLSRSDILKKFKSHSKAVLLGTNSFWEGIDVRGEALSNLIIYKLPFQVPNDPLVESFIQKMEREGKNSFNNYILPNSLLRYKQGFGRLIRHKTDKGVMITLDKRIFSKYYGRFFKDVLPTTTIIANNQQELMGTLKSFYNKQN